ncbi:hypothetical protein [Sphingobacterium sp.]|uniref:hypothetical protein n=1 Tax=Sphingobacterium sp. TaxID=341027 RepID=UPI00129C23FB
MKCRQSMVEDLLATFFLSKVADLIVDSIGYSMNNPEPGWNSTSFGHYGGARP